MLCTAYEWRSPCILLRPQAEADAIPERAEAVQGRPHVEARLAEIPGAAVIVVIDDVPRAEENRAG